MYRPVLILTLALALGSACSDDDKQTGADSGAADQKVTHKETGTPDQKIIHKETGVTDQSVKEQGAGDQSVKEQGAGDQGATDKAMGDATGGGDASSVGDASAPAIQTNTEAFIKVLANKLPSGATTDKVEKFVPTDVEAKPWAEDTSAGPKGVQSAYNDKAIELIINGHHAPFATEGTAGFAKEDYKTGKDTLQLFIWEMNKAASATKLVNDFKTKLVSTAGLTFLTIAGVKDLAIIADDSPNWRAFGHKGKYIYEVTSTKGF